MSGTKRLGYLLCLALTFGAFQNCAPPQHSGGTEEETSSGGIGYDSPQVSIASPLDGDSVSGDVVLNALAADDVGVTQVQFYVDGVALGGPITSAPYSFTFVSTTVKNGNHTLLARASDADGHVTPSAPVSVSVSNTTGGDNTKPTVSLTAPMASAAVTGTVTVSANASDNVGVAGVQFYVDGLVIGAEDTTSPYSVSWNSSGIANGSHNLTAVARDAAGNKTTSAAVLVTSTNSSIDSTAPTVSISAPAAGSSVNGSVTVTATASDNIGVVGVKFFVDGAMVNTEDTSSPYSTALNTVSLSNGTHSLTAQARDAAGNMSTSAAVSVTVNNVASNGNYTWLRDNIFPLCIGCHSGATASAGLKLDTYTGVRAAVVPGSPSTSKLYLRTSDGSMPRNGTALSNAELKAIFDWITAGAPNN